MHYSGKYYCSFIVLFIFTLSFSNITSGQPGPPPPGGPTAADVDCTGCVDTVDIADNAVTSAEIEDNAVTTAKIANDAVTGDHVEDNTLTSDDIQDNSLTADDILDGDGSGLDADMLDGFNAQQIMIPQGGIIMWSGAIADIPDGWALCNGQPGTPDLSDRFILSVAANEDPGETGGSDSHEHSGSVVNAVGDHYHLSPMGRIDWPGAAGAYYTFSSTWGTEVISGVLSNTAAVRWRVAETSFPAAKTSGARAPGSTSFNVDSASQVPPYYKLAFIMRR